MKSEKEKTFDISKLKWINEPEEHKISSEEIEIITKPETDFWQRTYYNFRNDNAHALIMEKDDDFTFTVQTTFNSKKLFDQCGVIIYQNSNNWFKASIEYENENISRLGSVVTNSGYSDWATTDINAGIKIMWYRLSRRGPDFLIESSPDGTNFKQMRIFHLHCLGETSVETGTLNSPASSEPIIKFGLYACSPLKSSFEAKFNNFKLENCLWKSHSAE